MLNSCIHYSFNPYNLPPPSHEVANYPHFVAGKTKAQRSNRGQQLGRGGLEIWGKKLCDPSALLSTTMQHWVPGWAGGGGWGKYTVMKESGGFLPNSFCKHTGKEPALSSSQPHLDQYRGTPTRLQLGALPGASNETQHLIFDQGDYPTSYSPGTTTPTSQV